jgi:hypothetical protein
MRFRDSGSVGIVSSFSAATVGVLGVVSLQPAAQLLQDARGRLQVGAVDPARQAVHPGRLPPVYRRVRRPAGLGGQVPGVACWSGVGR